jgi:outer membrane protein
LYCLLVASCGFAGPALAADDYGTPPQEEAVETSSTDLSFRIGIGGLVQPDYEGSDNYDVVPWPIVSLEYLKLPGLNAIGGRTVGFSVGPSFNFVGERNQGDNPALAGLGDIDAAFEAGLKATYEVNYWGAYAAVRRGFGGHEGIVGEAVLYTVWRPTDSWVVRAGPNTTFGNSEYMNTYFSVTPAQSAASGFPVYNAGSGFKSVGLQANAIYSLTEKVDLHFRAGYDRLVSGAGDSPIVETAGSRNQFTAGVGVSYRVDLDLFR